MESDRLFRATVFSLGVIQIVLVIAIAFVK
jgi:hypothetical protein